MKPEYYSNIYSDKNRESFCNYLKLNVKLDSNILEIGPGPGLSTKYIEKYAKKLTLVEPDFEYYSYLIRNYKDKKFNILNGYLCDSPLEKYDSIVMVFNVINHIKFQDIKKFIRDLAIRTKKNTKIYFDLYNSNCVKEVPPKKVSRILSDGKILTIKPFLIDNILELTYKLENEIIDEMRLYLHEVHEIVNIFKENQIILKSKPLLGRDGDCYFYEIFTDDE